MVSGTEGDLSYQGASKITIDQAVAGVYSEALVSSQIEEDITSKKGIYWYYVHENHNHFIVNNRSYFIRCSGLSTNFFIEKHEHIYKMYCCIYYSQKGFS